MTDQILYGIGDILKIDNSRERIIAVEYEEIITCKMDTNRLIFHQYNRDEIIAYAIEKKISIIHDLDSIKVIDYDSIPPKYQEIYNENVSRIKDFINLFGPTYIRFGKKGSNCSELAKKHNVSLKSYMKLILKYFQSGCNNNVLYSGLTNGLRSTTPKSYAKKTGRPGKYNNYKCIVDSTVKEQFNDAINSLLKSNRRWTSIVDAYDYVIQKYYTKYYTENGVTTYKEAPVEERPTYRQFYTYYQKHTNQLEKDIVKTSLAEVRNDKRIKRADTMYGVYGVGDLVECDACEMDVGLVKIDNVEQSIGRPVVYCMIDVASRVILAVSVSFENNSFLGITNLLLNLSDDKVEYCRQYGIDIDPALWPSNIIPKRIRFDRGAENTSHKLQEVLQRLHIERELVTAATGSLKGNIEQQFRQMHLAQNMIVENKGLIEKRHDSNHHKEAVLTIEEYTKIIINFVLSHNQNPDLSYKLTRDMIEDGNTDTTPINLWNYWNRVTASPRPITSANVLQYRYDLMLSYTAKVNNEGIHFIGGHIYDNFEDKDLQTLKYENVDRKTNFEVRYDPRNVNYLYYTRNSRLCIARINTDKQINGGFINLTFEEMKKLDAKRNQILAANRKTHDEVRRNRNSANRAVANGAVQRSTGNYANTKDMRTNRELEKQNVRYSNSIATRLLPENCIDIASCSVSDYIENNAKETSLPESTSKEEVLSDNNATEEMQSDVTTKEETSANKDPSAVRSKDVMNMTDEELAEYEEQVNWRLNHIS